MTHEDSTGEKNDVRSGKKSDAMRRRDKHFRTDYSQWFYAPCERRCGEEAMWIAVIAQAVLDAISRGKNAEARSAKNDAIRWLTDGGKDFIEVCLLAGYDPDYIRRQSKRIIATPTRWRAEPGKGKRYLERKAYRERYEKHRRALRRPKAPAIVVAFAWQQERTS